MRGEEIAEGELFLFGLRVSGKGNGPIDAFTDALNRHCGLAVRIVDYHEHAIGAGADAIAVSYVEIRMNGEPAACFGVGIDSNIVTASLNAVMSAVNRALRATASESGNGELVSRPEKVASQRC
jgi:2-isopropylmalate synthase